MLVKNNRACFFFDESTDIFLEVPTFVSSLSMGSFKVSVHISKVYSFFLTLSFCLLSRMNSPVQDVVCQIIVFNKEHFRISITETSPYSFGNFRKLSLYNCFMPI